MAEMARITTLDGDDTFPAYVSKPRGTPGAAIVVIQEVFGINEGIRRKCDAWAQAGYLAVAPDLFWRFKPGIELDPDVPEQMQEALDYFGRYDAEDGVHDIAATIRRLRDNGTAKVGCVGFCLGGKLAYMTACRTDVDASVAYYPVGIDQMLGEAEAIARPLLVHIASADGFVSAEAQGRMHEGLDPLPQVTLHDYPGLDHGFAAEMGQRRDETGARLADQRTIDFFARYLG